MRIRGAATLLLTGVLAVGCGGESPPLTQQRLDSTAPTRPGYNPFVEPAEAVLALVPVDDTELVVTDFAEVRLELGFPELTSKSSRGERARFAQRSSKRAALLSPGMLRPVDEELRTQFSFGQDDVEWEAQFDGPAGAGWVIRLRDDLDDTGVRQAVEAGFGPLGGAEYYPSSHIILRGGTIDPETSWATIPDLVALVGQPAVATYLSTSCLPTDVALGSGSSDDLAESPAADLDLLDDLGPFSVSFGATLVTARLGRQRGDLSDRARLAEIMPDTTPEFGLGYRDAVVDPAGGRIGYTMGDGPTAARLALDQHLPFAVCASS